MADPLNVLRAHNAAHADEAIVAIDALDCGHAPTPTGIGTGTAHTPEGKTMCYACAARAEVAAFAKASVFTGYVSASKPGQFTTWTGEVLAKVTSSHLSDRWTPTGGQYRMRYITAIAPDGSTWHGRGSDHWELFTLRKASSA